MGNKKRKQSSQDMAPKISYGLSRSMIEQSQLQTFSNQGKIITSASGSKEVKNKKRKKDFEQLIIENTLSNSCHENIIINDTTVEKSDLTNTEISTPAEVESTDNSNYIRFDIGTSQSGAIIFTSLSKVLHVSGFCTVRLLFGRGNVNGYRLKIGETISIQSPPWMPAIRLFFEPSLSDETPTKRLVNDLVKSNPHFGPHRDSLMEKLSSSMAIIEVISVDLLSQNWMIRSEDYSKYKPQSQSASSIIFFPSAVVGESSDLSILGLDSQILPTDWVIGGDVLCKSLKSSPRAVIFGAKGVGKSTTLRYLINRVLSKTPYVAILDCDIGQPEFTPSGFLSLHILSQNQRILASDPNSFIPLLSPPHLHLHKPDFSFYLGDITIKNLPDAFERCVTALFSKYQLYADFYQTTGRIPLDHNEVTEENIQEFSHTSNFHLLSHESDDIQFPLPLIVNTDGMIRGMGLEIQRTVLSITRPTHVYHIQSEKDKFLVPLEEAKNNDTEKKLHISLLTPGRISASRIAAQDLRDIRLISYFLYNNQYLNGIGNASTSVPIHIRNGACVDSAGHLPTALMYLTEESVAISQSCFHLIGSTIPPRLLLAAFNVSIVGITTSPTQMNSQENYRTTRLQVPNEVFGIDATSNTTATNTICLNYEMNESSLHLLPCEGLGIISDFDLQRSIVHIITPEDLVLPNINDYRKESLLHLTRGIMQLPSSLMYNISGQVCAPYLCSENFGEGSAALYARSNIKRRSHGK